ncbi:MAG: hypothetical protein QXK37_00555 [Candidatus Woesearchaeota archaeon]
MIKFFNWIAQTIKKDDFQNIVIIIFGIFSAILTLAFFSMSGRSLSPEEYSRFGILLSIYFVVLVISSTIYNVVLRYVSYFKAKSQEGKISEFSFDVIVISFLAGIILMALILVCGELLHTRFFISYSDIVMLGLIILAQMLLNVVYAILNGLQKLFLLAFYRLASAVVLLVCGILLIEKGTFGVLTAIFISLLVLLPIGFFGLRKFLFYRSIKIGEMGIFGYIVRAAILSIFFAVILNIDVFIAKLFLTSEESGNYAAAALLGKLPFFIASSFVTIIFPKAAELESDGKDSSFLLKYGIISTSVLSFGLTLLYFAFPSFFVGLFFSHNFKIGFLFAKIAIASSLLAITNIILMYHLAIKKYAPLYAVPLFGVAIMLAFLLDYKTSGQIAALLLAASILITITTLFITKDALREAFFVRGGYRGYDFIRMWLKFERSTLNSDASKPLENIVNNNK